jgi:SAM-dependent methyltransferase
MPIVGHLTSAQLRKYIDLQEGDQQRRERLFLRLGEPRSVIINNLRDEILNFVVSEQCSLHGSLVLDYGCGNLPYRMAFRATDATLIGVDIGKNRDAQIQISDEGFLPLANNSFDYVVSFQVLEHIPVPHDYLSECYRVLKPGGKLFLTTHGIWPYHPTPGDYHRWTKDGIILEIKRVGLKVISTGNILNEDSAALQSFIINLHYRKKFKGIKKIIHWATNIIIRLLERNRSQDSQFPAIISVVGLK